MWVFPLAANESKLWLSSTAKVWQSDDHNTGVLMYGEVRGASDFSEYNGFFWGPIVRHQLNKHLNIGGGYKFINIKSSQGDFNNLNRMELEFTPSFSFGDMSQYKLALRNRVEVIKDHGKEDKVRLRHRLTFNKKYAGNGIINSLFMSHELIYIHKGGHSNLDQYRFIPLGIKLNILEQRFNGFFMIQRKNNSQGDTNYILGLSYFF
jgi:hypothetical protein